MNKYLLLYIYVLLYGGINFTSAQNSTFRLYRQPTQTVQVNKQMVQKQTLPLFTEKKPIQGLSVSGTIKFLDPLGIVRILLVDDLGNEHLVYEAYPSLGLGMDITFEHACEETALLESLHPDRLKVIVEKAELVVESIQLVEAANSLLKTDEIKPIRSQLRKSQLEEKINRINAYNEEHEVGWFAGMTDLAQFSYAEKKRVLHAEENFNTQGFEYYVSGYFTLKSEDPNMQQDNLNTRAASAYTDYFDWRNRHGVNWDTPIKHQGNGGGCWAFTAAAGIEVYTNLYFNKKLDLDLSEQQFISCSDGQVDPGSGGGLFHVAINWAKQNWIVNESCFPFLDNDRASCNPCSNPTERIKVISSGSILMSSEDYLKGRLIEKGPIMTSIHVPGWSHAMLILGYGTVKVGDRIRTSTNGNYQTIQSGNSLIGKTYWIFKNSYGTSSANNGYHYIVLDSMGQLTEKNSTYLQGGITRDNHIGSRPVCEDKDGDGYYYWGIGPKPTSCPDCAPDEPDGDDSNPYLGPLNARGECIPITPPAPTLTTISNAQTWTNNNPCGNLLIKSGGTLTITGNVKVQPAHSITIENGGKLIVSGGKLEGGIFQTATGGTIETRNNGQIIFGDKR